MKIPKLKYLLIVVFCLSAMAGFAVRIPRGAEGEIFRAKSAIIAKDFKKARQYTAKAARTARKQEVKNKVKFLDAVIEAGTGNYDSANKKLKAVFDDKIMSVEIRFEAFAAAQALNAVKENISLNKKALAKQAEKLKAIGLTPAKEYAALNKAAGLMISLGYDKIAQDMISLADILYKPENKIYNCRYVENAPPGAGGWFMSEIIKGKEKRESRFSDYNRKSAAMLFADITAGRSTASGKKKLRDYYLQNTAFYMVYNDKGWHIFFLSGEKNIENILADGKSAGALEVFFTPGLNGESYYQWISNLPDGKTSIYDWNSPHRGYRYLKDYLKTETVVSKKRIGTYVFIPWEALYDKLPLDGKAWKFSMIRWSPGGGFTWGGRVHETGQWGHIQWQKPSREQNIRIKKNIVRRAWAEYNKTKKKLFSFWTDKELGDPDFYNKDLKPVVVRLDQPKGLMDKPDKLTGEQINELFKKYVHDWMEFDFIVAELRREYLENKLIGK